MERLARPRRCRIFRLGKRRQGTEQSDKAATCDCKGRDDEMDACCLLKAGITTGTRGELLL